jgi:glycine hydroxymethyltransferase
LKEKEMDQVAEWIDAALRSASDEKKLAKIRREILEFTKSYPLPGEKKTS